MSKFKVPDKVLYVCTGSKCGKRGGKELFKRAEGYFKHSHIDVEVIRTDCTDRCEFAPVCAIQPGNTWLKEYNPKDVIKLLESNE
jgi:NADH:ubiquinone oxidoreductase subunit E